MKNRISDIFCTMTGGKYKKVSIDEELKIDLPRPRDIASPEFVRLREYVTSQIKWW